MRKVLWKIQQTKNQDVNMHGGGEVRGRVKLASVNKRRYAKYYISLAITQERKCSVRYFLVNLFLINTHFCYQSVKMSLSKCHYQL